MRMSRGMGILRAPWSAELAIGSIKNYRNTTEDDDGSTWRVGHSGSYNYRLKIPITVPRPARKITVVTKWTSLTPGSLSGKVAFHFGLTSTNGTSHPTADTTVQITTGSKQGTAEIEKTVAPGTWYLWIDADSDGYGYVNQANNWLTVTGEG